MTKDQNDSNQPQDITDQTQAPRAGDLVCQAEDLKGLLQQIAYQITDADKRHSVSLRDMHERLELIGNQAQRVKTSVPAEFQPAFERIEDAVSLLGDRISLVDRERQARQFTQDQGPDQDAEPMGADPIATPDADLPQTQTTPAAAATTPMPFKTEVGDDYLVTGDDHPQDMEAIAAFAAMRQTPLASPIIEPEIAEPQPDTAVAEPQFDTIIADDQSPATLVNEPTAPPASPALSQAAQIDEAPYTPAASEVEPSIPADDFSQPVDPAQPWSTASAQALADLCDSGDANLAPIDEADLAPVDPVQDGVQALNQPAETSASAVAATVPGNTGADMAQASSTAVSMIDEAWLESRFADIAARVETSLSDMQKDASVEIFSTRFDQFEEKVNDALEDVVKKADIAGLARVEEQIAELSGHLEHTRDQLGRLDGIEDQIADVLRHVAKEPTPVVVEGPSDREIQAIAATVARQVTNSIEANKQPEMSSGQIGDIADLLKSYMSERREGDINTSGALDTMQSALVHLLERVDSMESSVTAPPAPSARASAADTAMSTAAQVARTTGHGTPQEYVREAVRFQIDPDEKIQAGTARELDQVKLNTVADEARRAADQAAKAAARSLELPGQATRMATRAPSNPAQERRTVTQTDKPAPGGMGFRSELIARTATAPQSAPRTQQAMPPKEGMLPAGGERADFIAQARRAQQLAGERNSQKEAETTLDKKSDSLKSRLSAAATKAGSTIMAKTRSGTASSSNMPVGKPVLLVGATLAVLSIGALLHGKMSQTTDLAGATVQESIAPASISAQTTKAGNMQALPNQAGMATSDQPDGDGPSTDSGMLPEPTSSRGGKHNLSAVETRREFGNDHLAPTRTALINGANHALPGITVYQSKRRLSAAAFERIQAHKQEAKLSLQLGEQGEDNLEATPIALNPRDQTGATARDDRMGAAASRALDMPPALIGPTSLRMAAANGDPSAEFEIAARFAEGQGIDQNMAKAYKWYQRSATRGFAPAQYRLGTLFERGIGIGKDMRRARIWYQRSADQGNIKAMHNLAVISAGNANGGPDYTTAAKWFVAAGERGLADSQFNLGILFSSGLGVKTDQIEAYKWFSLAAKSGDKQAGSRRDLTAKLLSRKELSKAKQLVRAWRQAPVKNLVNDARIAGQSWSQGILRNNAG